MPPGIQNAFEQAVRVRQIIKQTIKPGVTAQEAESAVYAALTEEGFNKMKDFNQYTEGDVTDVIIGCHPVGNWGHSVALYSFFQSPSLRLT